VAREQTRSRRCRRERFGLRPPVASSVRTVGRLSRWNLRLGSRPLPISPQANDKLPVAHSASQISCTRTCDAVHMPFDFWIPRVGAISIVDFSRANSPFLKNWPAQIDPFYLLTVARFRG